MGFRFRKSINLGPFRATLSKSGVSASVGVKGYRVTKLANGKTMKTASVPGTGISHVKVESKKPKKKKRGLLGILGLVIILCLALSACAPENSKEEKTKPSSAATEAATTRDDVAAVVTQPEPASELAPDPKPQPTLESQITPAPETAAKNVLNPQPPADFPEPDPEPVPAPDPKPEPALEMSEPVSPAVIGNKNSKVYHELDCGSVKKMKDSNKIPFDNADEAKAKGYEPCQNCH